MPDPKTTVAGSAEMIRHANQVGRQADEDDFRDRNRQRIEDTAFRRRVAARLRQDYGGASG
jgi:hypothetical protein